MKRLVGIKIQPQFSLLIWFNNERINMLNKTGLNLFLQLTYFYLYELLVLLLSVLYYQSYINIIYCNKICSGT